MRLTTPTELFENVVDGAVLESLDGNFFTERAGHEDERDIWRTRGRNLLRGETIERRNAIVDQNDVEGFTRKRRLELFARRNGADGAAEPVVPERR
jgi:hypothetical protein